MVRTRSLAVLTATAALFASPALAHATTYCVNTSTSCVGTPAATIQDALTLAQNHGGPDTVQLGPGSYDVGAGATYNAPDPVFLVGAGQAASIITSSTTDVAQMLTLMGSGASTVSELGVDVPRSTAA